MNWQNLLYNSIENNNFDTFKALINSPHIIPEKYNNKAISMAYIHQNNEIFDILIQIKSVKQAVYNDSDKTLLHYYQKRKILKNLKMF